MLKLFKKKTKAEQLDAKYRQLLSEAYKLSTINRRESDKKMDEANQVLEEIESLQKS